MKVTALILSSVAASSEFFAHRVARDVEDPSLSPDYPEEGRQKMLNVTGGSAENFGRSAEHNREKIGIRKIVARKRIINSQITTPAKNAWYYHYHDYGCYCVAPSDETKNRGKPVDEIDSACKRHNMCYACAFSDFSTRKEECNPKQTGYKYSIKDVGAEKPAITCLNDKNTCQYAACSCDKALAEELGRLVMRGTLAEKEYMDYDGEKCSAAYQRAQAAAQNYGSNGRGDGAAGGGFVEPPIFHDDSAGVDFEGDISFIWGADSEGNTGERSEGVQKQCCGVYPNRAPFKAGGNHECCDIGKSTEELKPLGTC